MIEKIYFDNLRVLKNLLKAAIRKHEEADSPEIYVDEIREALNHISKAIDILDRNDL